MAQEPKIYTPKEASRFIPALTELLPELRQIRDNIFQERDQSDVEEITSFGATGDTARQIKEKMDQHKANILRYETAFEKKLRIFDEIGCDVKSLDPGLVDFYTKSGNELVYLCWKEGEDNIRFWHTLTGGFSGRRPLE